MYTQLCQGINLQKLALGERGGGGWLKPAADLHLVPGLHSPHGTLKCYQLTEHMDVFPNILYIMDGLPQQNIQCFVFAFSQNLM